MSLSIRLLPEARAEFDAATDRYEAQKDGLGVTFVTRIREALDRIAADPQLHAPVYLDLRKAVVPKSPYVIL